MSRIFPNPESAQDDGLLAVGKHLNLPLLVEAYRNGIFPWSQDPVSWWCPPQRSIFQVGTVRLDRTTRKFLSNDSIKFTTDRAFEAVIRACAESPRKGESTWIGSQFIAAYSELHDLGMAHSVECWENKELIGGLYGVAIGGMFAGESMFYRRPNASKAAFAALDYHLKLWGFRLIDSQVPNPFTTSLGAITIPRKEFLNQLRDAVSLPARWGAWDETWTDGAR